MTMDQDVSPTLIYTESLCGFAARLSKSQVRAVSADPRVASVVADREFTATSS